MDAVLRMCQRLHTKYGYNPRSVPGHGIMGEEEPEAKDRLGEDIKDSVSNDFSINAGDARSIGNTPDASETSVNTIHIDIMHSHWVHGPENESESGNSAEECSSLGILVLDNATAVDSKLIDDHEIGNASHGIPTPLGTLLDGESSEKAGQDHDDVSNDGNEDVGTSETSEQAEIEEQEWGGDTPVDVTGPVDLTVDGLLDVRDGTGRVVDGGDGVVGDTILDGHTEIRDHSECGDEGSEDVEQAFLLHVIFSTWEAKWVLFGVYVQPVHGRP